MITFYHTDGCPKCKILEKALLDKNIEFESIKDENVMIEKGFTSAPMLEVDGKALTFPQALKYINEGEF